MATATSVVAISIILLIFPISIIGFDQDGGWSPWSKIETPCQISPIDTSPVLCNGGVRIRYRSCTMPVPQGQGQPCNGENVKYEPCNVHACQLPNTHLWSEWSLCSKICGRGYRKRHTMCGNIRRKGAFIENSKNFEDHPATLVTTTSAEIPATTMIDSLDDDDKLKDTEGNIISELEYEEKCKGNQYIEETEPCNSWNKEECPSPCVKIKCPPFAKCNDISNDTDPLFECNCQLGTVKKEDRSACIAPPPETVTRRPIPTLPPPVKTTATIITRGASLILIGFLTVTLLLFAISNIWDTSRILHFNMEISLLLAHICLLPPNLYEKSEEMCKFVSILIHFFHLACFSFMFLESLHLYSLVGWVVKSGGLMTPARNVLMGWLIPIVILMFNMSFQYQNYGGEYHCWLRMDTGLMYGQFIPIAVMTIISLTIIEAAGDASDYNKLEEANENERRTAKIMQRTLVVILPTVFASFLLGTLAEYDQNMVLYSIVTVVNGILGGMIFFCHTMTNEKIRQKVSNIKNKLCGRSIKDNK